jgi:hypothetical protein
VNRVSVYATAATLAVAAATTTVYAAQASANVSVACEQPATAVVTLTGWTPGDQVDTVLTDAAGGPPLAAQDALYAPPATVWRVPLVGQHALVATARRHGPGQVTYSSGAPVECGVPVPTPAPQPVPPETTPGPVPPAPRVTCADLRARRAGVRWLRQFGCAVPHKRHRFLCTDIPRGAGAKWYARFSCPLPPARRARVTVVAVAG